MTDEILRGLAMQALNMMKRDIEQGRDVAILLAVYHEGEGLHRMKKIEDYLVERLGADWMSDGDKKDGVFGVIRLMVRATKPHAVVMVTSAWSFKATQKLAALPVAEQRKILDAGHDRHHRAVKEGLLIREDILHAMAQSPERVCMAMQPRDLSSQPEVQISNQSGFSGRLKMYGEDKLEIYKEDKQ